MKQFLRDPVLRDKLAGKTIDPAFLTEILKEGSKADLNLMSKTL